MAITTAEPSATAGVLALFFVLAYVGQGLPPILLTVATRFVSLSSAMIGFSVAILAISVLAVRRQVTAARR